MVDSVERANMTHNWVNYMREIIENDIECIIYNAKEGNLEETKRQILVCIGKILAQKYDNYAYEKNYVYIFPRILLESTVVINEFDKNKTSEEYDEYKKYCRKVLYIIVELIEISYYKGTDYKAFIQESLNKKNISVNEEQIKALVLNFKKYVSKTKEVNGVVWNDLQAYRRKHEWLKDKNKNGGEQYYPPFSLLNQAVMEFEFYTRKLNESSNFDQDFLKKFQSISHDIWEKYGKGIIEEKEINGYSKLIKKPLEQLTEEEFDYMRKVLKVRLNYIRENTPEGTSFLAEWHIWKDIRLSELILNEEFPDLGVGYFQMIGQVLTAISLNEELENNDVLWEALIQLVDTINNQVEETECIAKFVSRLGNDCFTRRSPIRRFSETACIESLKKLTESLNQTDKEFTDFVEICLNALCIKHGVKVSRKLESKRLNLG